MEGIDKAVEMGYDPVKVFKLRNLSPLFIRGQKLSSSDGLEQSECSPWFWQIKDTFHLDEDT